MKYFLKISSPTEKEANALASKFTLSNYGLRNLNKVYWNLSTSALYEEILFRREGFMADHGPVIVYTGRTTGRSPGDKFVVKEATTENHIWWGEYNRPFSLDKFNMVLNRIQGYLQDRDLFVQDCYAGADPEYRLPIRIITEHAWQSLFARNMFIPASSNEELREFIPDFTVISIPSFNALPQIDGTRSETVILLNFDQRLVLIGNSYYGGEIKKSVFTVLNYLMPLKNVMSMHCSANVGPKGDVALFFGLSGTGKTSLSADPGRQLIGDDEHGWSDDGIFNYENGCYAKVIRLSPTAEPEIYACTRKFGTIIENVVYDPVSRKLDLDDDKVTENTRASYPLSFIDNALDEKRAGHPKNIIMLTCDANGVLPPIAKLTPDQAIYHFISGYTSKLSGTEVGLGNEPEITFSTCFGAPFMVHHPYYYANLLKQKIIRYKVNCWLVNTGWTGGPFGIGKRISIQYTRTLLNDALNGKLNKVECRKDPVFGFQVPKTCPGIPTDILDPSKSWPDKNAYKQKYRQLVGLFIENFKNFLDECPEEVLKAGPDIHKI
jgi:phosphoenolpyruvate carboxykinase (ATP)